MKKAFNLKTFRKQAFYEGSKGQIHTQSRCMMNCYKIKMEKGSSAQEAWQSCVDEYNNAKENDWALKYS